MDAADAYLWLIENSKGSNKIGTTLKGIGPAYRDKVDRIGFRLIDFKNKDFFRNKFYSMCDFLRQGPFSDWHDPYNDDGDELRKLEKHFDYIKDRVIDTVPLINNYVDAGKKVIFEGAQGTFIDIDHGSVYPYVTSSSPTAGGACLGAGIGPIKIKEVIGVTKAYTTRVGSGPFVTELEHYPFLGMEETKIADWIIDKGNEYGTTTKRMRRVGWLDLVALKRAVQVNGITSLAITKLDILSGLEYVKACIGYSLAEKTIDFFPNDLVTIEKVQPIYKEFSGWSESDNLLDVTKHYVEFIENFVGVKIKIISTGRNRDDTITL